MANESIGTVQELVAAREAKGMSVEDVQRQLKLHPRQVKAIEEGDWDALPGLPFVRGTLRNYGKLVGVDVAPLLETIGGYSKPAELRPSASLEEPLHGSGMLGFGNGGSGHPWIWIALVVVGLVALALYFGRDGELSKVPSWFGSSSVGSSESSPSDAAAGRRSEPVAIPSLPQPTETKAASPGDGVPGSVSAAATVTTPVTPAPPSVPPAVAAEPPAAAAAPTGPAGVVERVSLAPDAAPGETVPLQMTFDAESWIEIRSSTGKVLFTGTPKGNQTTIFATKGPVSVVVARPEKVRIEFDGKPVPSKLPPGASILKLKLPLP